MSPPRSEGSTRTLPTTTLHARTPSVLLVTATFGLIPWIGGCEERPKDEVTPATPTSTTSSFGSPFAAEPDHDPPPYGSEGPSHDDPDFFVTVEAPRRCPQSPPFLPPSGSERLSITLQIRAKTGRLVPVGPLVFSLEDEEGRRFGATLAGCGPALPRRDLQAPDEARGELAFDVPEGSRGLRLVFEPFLIGRSPIKIWLDLPSSATPAGRP